MNVPHSDALVFFGATGDLVYKKIFPALYAMELRGHLKAPVIRVARSDWTIEKFRARARASVEKQDGFDEAVFAKFAERLHYISGDYGAPATHAALREELGDAAHPLHYLAIPPSVFEKVIEGLGQSGCARGVRVILEKPFGRDLSSAQALSATLHTVFDESSIFRIDHYLGKESVRNILDHGYLWLSRPSLAASRGPGRKGKMMNTQTLSKLSGQLRTFSNIVMKTTFQLLNRRRFFRVSAALGLLVGLLVGLLWTSGLRAQSPDEHASHHPGQAGGAMPAAGAMSAGRASPAPAATPGGMGGMMGGGMGDMMKGMMGGAKTKELYPSLMDLPDLPLAKRLEVEQQAGERMHSGVALMNESLDYLLQATEQQNYTAMQTGTASLREGLARFESGLAAQRALAEGKAPRNVALTWFKRDMNLLPLPGADTKHTGLDVYHWFVMVLLIAFALAMVAMYFFKMRRCAALFGRIEADKGSPPPGSSPPLAGEKPTDGKKPSAGDKPAAPADKPATA